MIPWGISHQMNYHKSYFTILHRNFWVKGCGHHTLEGIIGRLRGRVRGRSPVLYVIVLRECKQSGKEDSMRVMLLMVVTPFHILRHNDEFRIFWRGCRHPPHFRFRMPAQTSMRASRVGEHPSPTFSGESECRVQNPIFVPTQHYPLAKQCSCIHILKCF